MGWLALLFIVVPVVELGLLIRLGGFLGLLPTLGLIMATGIIGASLAKQQGLSVFRRFQAETQAGRLPGDALLDGAIILFAGALLLTPGILTDIVGFLGLIPPARTALKRMLRASMARAVERGQVNVQTFVVGQPPPGFYPGAARSPHAPHAGGPIIDVTPDGTPPAPRPGSVGEKTTPERLGRRDDP